MTVIEFKCTRKPTEEERQAIRERMNDPYEISPEDELRWFYDIMGLDFDEMYETVIKDYLPDN